MYKFRNNKMIGRSKIKQILIKIFVNICLIYNIINKIILDFYLLIYIFL